MFEVSALAAHEAASAPRSIAERAVRPLTSAQVPTIGAPHLVLAVLRAEAEGFTYEGATDRQAEACLRTASLLGLCDSHGGLTTRGVAALKATGRGESARHVLEGFLVSDVARAWADWAGKPSVLDVNGETAAAFLETVAAQSPRRAQRNGRNLQRLLAAARKGDRRA